jgi:hypothetical protein
MLLQAVIRNTPTPACDLLLLSSQQKKITLDASGECVMLWGVVNDSRASHLLEIINLSSLPVPNISQNADGVHGGGGKVEYWKGKGNGE